MLVLPPLLWAGNAVVGRLLAGLVPPHHAQLPALAARVPPAAAVDRLAAAARQRAVAALAPLRRAGPAGRRLLQRAAVPGAEDVDAAQRDAGGRQHAGLDAGHRRPVLRPAHHRRQVAGAVLSITGVLVVLCRGDWDLLLQVRLVPGDFYVLLATIAWAVYSWLLVRPGDPPRSAATGPLS
jgi:hypothetical protein